jgi:hypothetical protein
MKLIGLEILILGFYLAIQFWSLKSSLYWSFGLAYILTVLGFTSWQMLGHAYDSTWVVLLFYTGLFSLASFYMIATQSNLLKDKGKLNAVAIKLPILGLVFGASTLNQTIPVRFDHFLLFWGLTIWIILGIHFINVRHQERLPLRQWILSLSGLLLMTTSKLIKYRGVYNDDNFISQITLIGGFFLFIVFLFQNINYYLVKELVYKKLLQR